MAVTINCDMGEGFGLYRCGDDAALMPHVSLANVACGFHAADPSVMHATVRLAKRHGVKVGAHPSLPDLQGFGRREMRLAPAEITDCVLYQVGALEAFLKAEGMALSHIKPHGALYGMAARSAEVAEAICDAAEVFQVPLLGLAGTEHEAVYRRRGFDFVAEFYADLDYGAGGELLITREHDPRDPGEAAARVLRAVREHRVRAVDGTDAPVRADSVCVHSDTPAAQAIARAVRATLDAHAL